MPLRRIAWQIGLVEHRLQQKQQHQQLQQQRNSASRQLKNSRMLAPQPTSLLKWVKRRELFQTRLTLQPNGRVQSIAPLNEHRRRSVQLLVLLQLLPAQP